MLVVWNIRIFNTCVIFSFVYYCFLHFFFLVKTAYSFKQVKKIKSKVLLTKGIDDLRNEIFSSHRKNIHSVYALILTTSIIFCLINTYSLINTNG